MITGCLQGPIASDEYASSGFGPQGVAEPSATFRLTNVTMKPMPPRGATYLIVGDEKQLSAQLGHHVQIVGTVVAPAPRGTTGAAPADPTADEYYESRTGKTASSTPGAADEPVVRVESVRMVSTKCP